MTKRGKEPIEYPLGPELGFLQHIWQLNHALEAFSRRMEARLGVTAQQRLIIRCIGKYPGLTAGQLATILRVDPGTVSAALRRLEGKTFVERRRDVRDSRRVSLGLTAAGRALDRPADGTVEDAVARLLATTNGNDLAVATRVLERLTRFLEEASGDPSPGTGPQGDAERAD